MEVYNFKRSQEGFDLDKLASLLNEGQKKGLDLKDVINKIDSIKSTIEDGVIRIVLLGSFSDGKTSTIAGLLGRLDDTMKIDNDESSDELLVYRPQDLKDGFEIVDTPGLFGTKEKEVDGEFEKLSDKTLKYISEAHIVIYVCGAVNPVKESHIPILKKVLRDFNKLKSTIFVVNKMDDVADVTDESDFKSSSNTKRSNVLSRLRGNLSFSSEEEAIVKANIVCISANPYGEGLPYWFENSEEYMRSSHIRDLRNVLDNVLETANKSELQDNAINASVMDVIKQTGSKIALELKPLNNAIQKCEDEQKHLAHKFDIEDDNLKLNRKDLIDKLNEFKIEISRAINNATYETIGGVLNDYIGVEKDKVTFYIFKARIDACFKICATNNSSILKGLRCDMEVAFENENKLLKDGMKDGMKFLKGLQINGGAVKAVRDLVAPAVKFKPWEAVKLAKNISKGIAIAGVVLDIGIAIYNWWRKKKNAEKCQELQNALIDAINSEFADLFSNINNDELYYDQFAPTFKEMKALLVEKDKEITELKTKLQGFENYKNDLNKFFGREIIDVEFDEI